MSFLRIFTDGSCLKTGHGGIGICFPNQEYSNQSIAIKNKTTNQRTELFAIRYALSLVKDDKINIEITSDSKYSIGCLTQWYPNWVRNNSLKNKKNLDIIAPTYKKIKNRTGKTIFKHVRGHQGNRWNEVADKLATDASACAKKNDKNN